MISKLVVSKMREEERVRFALYAASKGFQGRVGRSYRLVTQALERMQNPYIAFSTGKDSLCVAHLVWEQRDSVPAVYFDADCAFAESYELLDRMEVIGRPIIHWKSESLMETFRRAGGPDARNIEAETMRSTVYRPIRGLLREYNFDGVFLGLRAEESPGRAKLGRYRGQLFWQTRDRLWECLPILDWSYLDVWAFIVSQNLDYCHVYDRMWDMPEQDQRLSYWAGETKRAWGRWAWLKRNYLELFNRFAAEFPEVRRYV